MNDIKGEVAICYYHNSVNTMKKKLMTCLYICLSVIHVFAQTREHGRTGEFNILDFGATRDTMMGEERAEKGVWAEYRVMPTAGRAISFLFHVKGYVSQVSV